MIALAANYGYLRQTETTIKSILYHNSLVKIYLLNCDIPQEWFININQYVNQFGAKIVDTKFNPELIKNLNSRWDYINEMAYARFLIPKLIPDDRVLYLDSDLIVDDQIDELQAVDFKDKEIMAVPDYGDANQFNSGVMLMNNQKLKQDGNLSQKLLSLSADSKLDNGDQSVLNAFFKGKIFPLPAQYNYQVGYDYNAFWHHSQYLLDKLNSIKHPKIIHYLTFDKPFNFISHGRMREKWWFYHNLELAQLVQKHTVFNSLKIGPQKFKGQVFIFTRRVEIEHLEELIKDLPDVRFNVAAYTNVAWPLLELQKYFNYRIYPNVAGYTLHKCIADADLYLDINLGAKQDEIVDQVKKRHIPFLAFKDSAYQQPNYDNYTIFANDQVQAMASKIKQLLVQGK